MRFLGIGNTIFGRGGAAWLYALPKVIFDKLAGWWFVQDNSDEDSNEVIDLISGNSAKVLGTAFKGDDTAKATYGSRFAFFVPGYEDFVLSWQVVLASIDTDYAVVLSDYNSVASGRIQFNNTTLYLYDNNKPVTTYFPAFKHTFIAD